MKANWQRRRTMKSMEWPRLLCRHRLGTEEEEKKPLSSRSVFQQDFDRVIFSTGFRRLQDKTQVFPLADNDFVRTRLTHSLETSSVGRSLGTMAGEKICARHGLADSEGHPSDFGAIVAAACIAHDIGNPPFGHSGEDAIRHWFEVFSARPEMKHRLSAGERLDIERYEGNAQGFRLITRLLWPDNRGGLQLTAATLAAFTKYPVTSTISRQLGERKVEAFGQKKFGFFETEKEFFAEIAERVGLLSLPDYPGGWVRHPLVFLVEAADDICYRLNDFEDGFRLKLISYEEIRELFLQIVGPGRAADKLAHIASQKEQIEYLRSVAIGRLVYQITEAFMEREEAILAGALTQPLIQCIAARETLQVIERRSVEDVYAADQVVEIEAAGFEVLGGLLEIFTDACLINPGTRRSQKMIEILPEQFRPTEGLSSYRQLLQLLDFVSGMTDSYAVSLYKKLKGISLPGQ